MLQPADLNDTNQALIDMLYQTDRLPIVISYVPAGYIEELIYRYGTYHMFHHPKTAFFPGSFLAMPSFLFPPLLPRSPESPVLQCLLS